MFQEIRRLTRHTLIYGVGHIFSGVVGFLLLPLHTNLLPQESLGILAVLRMSLAFGHIAVLHGLEVGYVQYFARDAALPARRRLLSSMFWAVSAGAACTCGLLWFGADAMAQRIPAVADWPPLFRLCAVILFFDTVSTPLLLTLRAEERSRRYVSVRMLGLGTDLVGNVLLVGVLGFGLAGILWSQLAGILVAGVLLLPSVVKFLGWTFSAQDWSRAFRFGFPATLAGLALLVVDAGDRYFITRLMNVGAAGVYFANYRLAMAMALIVAAFRFAWHPFFLSVARQANAPQIYARVLTYYMLAGCWALLAVSLLAEDIVRIELLGATLVGREYWAGTSIVPLIALSYLLYGVYSNFDVGVYVKERTWLVPLVIFAGAALNVGLNWALIPMYGLSGAAWATVAAYGVMCGLMYRLSQRLLPIPYDWRRLGVLSILTATLYGGGVWLHHPVADALLLAAYPVILLGFGFFHRSELARVMSAIRIRLQ